MSDAYSPLKATRHLQIIGATRDQRPAPPAHVQLILSDLCNQSCNFCAYRDPNYSSSQLFYQIKPDGSGLRRDPTHPERNYNPVRWMAYDKAIEIVDDCFHLGVAGIQFTGGGEPTVHPQFAEVLEYASQRASTALVTNGVLVGKNFERWRRPLLQLSWIRFSLDAGWIEQYSKIRNVPDWHFASALAGIRELRLARDEEGRGPVIGVGFVVTPENWSGVYDAARLAKNCGADNIRISAQFSSEDERLFRGFHEQCSEMCKAAEGLSEPGGFTVYNRFGQKLDDLRQRAPDYDGCGYQVMTTYIGADLNVYRCCVLAYNERGVVGNLENRRFKDLWMDQKRLDEMLKFDARGCDRCQFNTINRNLEYMLRSDDPLHSEFV